MKMKTYLLRYLVFLLPALAVSYFYNNLTAVSQLLQWFFAFFMLLGWGVNTGVATYYFPRSTLSALLTYTGFNVLVCVCLYTAYDGSALRVFLRRYGGILSYKPLEIILKAIRDFNIPAELFVVGFVVAVCLIGYIAGLVHRRVRPNPYSPRMNKA